MDKQTYRTIEEHMLRCMRDAAHDAAHIYRVLYNALDIASYESGVDYDILLASCLLHDIGRLRQYTDPTLDHATEGGDMAYSFLVDIGYSPEIAECVKQCIITHRYRSSAPPAVLEAKILFDADKLEAAGAIGIARTLIYQGHVGLPQNATDDTADGADDVDDSIHLFFDEYNFKLKRVYAGFYTRRGYEIAQSRKAAAVDYYNNLQHEVTENRPAGLQRLEEVLG